MTLMSRVLAACTVMALAAIPVWALTSRHVSSDDAAKLAAAEPRREHSRLVNQNVTIAGDDAWHTASLAAKAPETVALVPQNPVSDIETASTTPVDDAPEVETEAEVTTSRKRPVRHAKKAARAPGSFDMLFYGPKK